MAPAKKLSPVPALMLAVKPKKKKKTKYWEQGKKKPLYLENKSTAIVILVGVSCIDFHSFALGILTDGKQKNLNPIDGLYKLPTNSTSFQVSAIPQ